MKKLSYLFIVGFLSLSSHSYAWGLLGHRIIGEIADSHLNRKTQRKIQQLLGNEIIAMAANWPDFVKSDPEYNYLSRWHYVDVTPGLSVEQVQQELNNDTAANVYNRLVFLIDELKNNSSLATPTKTIYLKLLIHLIGDIHQPMHVGRSQDLGGNKIHVFWFNRSTNFHKLWDEHLIDFQQLSYKEYTEAIDVTTPGMRRELQNTAPITWLFESYQLANDLYASIKSGDRLSYPYNYRYLSKLNTQLLRSGIRLAGVLNDIFG